jgi:hypothetical protein
MSSMNGQGAPKPLQRQRAIGRGLVLARNPPSGNGSLQPSSSQGRGSGGDRDNPVMIDPTSEIGRMVQSNAKSSGPRGLGLQLNQSDSDGGLSQGPSSDDYDGATGQAGPSASKRRRLRFDDMRVRSSHLDWPTPLHARSMDNSTKHEVIDLEAIVDAPRALPPMPRRRGKPLPGHAPAPIRKSNVLPLIKIDGRPKPYELLPPSESPLLPPNSKQRLSQLSLIH